MKNNHFAITIVTVMISYAFSYTHATENKYRLSFAQNAINTKKGYATVIKRSDNGWVVVKLDFTKTHSESPTLEGAYGALALDDCIVVPLINGQVNVYDTNLTNLWSFSLAAERIVATWARLGGTNRVALLSVNPTTEKKYLQIYEINMEKKCADELHFSEVESEGSLSLYFFGGSLWLVTPESAKLIYQLN